MNKNIILMEKKYAYNQMILFIEDVAKTLLILIVLGKAQL